MKTLIKTASLLVFASFFACSNYTADPDKSSDASATTVTEQGLVITGTSDSASVEILLADNYLKKVKSGNPYTVTPPTTPAFTITYPIKTQVKITKFSYFNKSVDITCSKDETANKLDVVLSGSNPSGHAVTFFPETTTGAFLAIDNVTSTSAIQTEEDEIEKASIYPGLGLFGTPSDIVYTFICKGSDGNDYNVIFHGNYDMNNMALPSIFDLQKGLFTGVIGVSLRDFNDAPVYMFFDK